MLKHPKLLVSALSATVILAVTVGLASANRLAINEQGKKATFASMEFTGGGATVRCPVTLEGSFHSRTISKVLEALIGYITKTTVGTCTGGNGRANTETLPWHLRYAGFSGTLPTITRIQLKLIRPSFTIAASAIPVPCRYTPGEITAEGTRESNGGITAITFARSNIASETFGCPATNEFRGSGAPSTPSGGALIITLVV